MLNTGITVFCLRRPSEPALRQWLIGQSGQPFCYASVGASREALAPRGWFVNQARVRLGAGAATYQRARKALANWRMIPAWVGARAAGESIELGSIYALSARYLGVWTVNACRVVYVIDEPGEIDRFGFGAGTLHGHAMSGEERFLVTWDHGDDSVWYEVWSFSRPRHWLAWAAVWLIRRLQQRFAVDSAAAMLQAATGGKMTR